MEFALQETAFWFASAGKVISGAAIAFGRHLADHVIPHHRNNYHPHLLGHRTLALFSLLLVAVKVVAIFSVLSFEAPITEASAITVDNVINLANQSRQDYGLNSLSQNSQLTSAAQAKANDMLARQYFAHNTPTGETPWVFIKNAGYKYLMAGENLAVDYTESEDVEQAWMNSPGHRANILNKNFSEIGVGISQGQFEGHESIFVVQMFGSPAEQPVAVAQAPTKVEKPAANPAPKPAPKPFVKSAQAAPPAAVAKPAPVQVPPAPTQASQTQPVAEPETLKIIDSSIKVADGSVLISAATSSLAVKVIAQFGDLAVMLDPKDNNQWTASIPLSKLAASDSAVTVKAYDVAGAEVRQELASFAKSTADNFRPMSAAAARGGKISTGKTTDGKFLGMNINVKDFETKFYLIFISGILAAMILAIGIKRHIQHLSLIANSSFVAVFALMLWMAG